MKPFDIDVPPDQNPFSNPPRLDEISVLIGMPGKFLRSGLSASVLQDVLRHGDETFRRVMEDLASVDPAAAADPTASVQVCASIMRQSMEAMGRSGSSRYLPSIVWGACSAAGSEGMREELEATLGAHRGAAVFVYARQDGAIVVCVGADFCEPDMREEISAWGEANGIDFGTPPSPVLN